MCLTRSFYHTQSCLFFLFASYHTIPKRACRLFGITSVTCSIVAQAPSHHEISSELLSKPANALVHLADGSTVQLGFSCTTLVRESLTTLAEDLGLELDDTFALYVQFEVRTKCVLCRVGNQQLVVSRGVAF